VKKFKVTPEVIEIPRGFIKYFLIFLLILLFILIFIFEKEKRKQKPI